MSDRPAQSTSSTQNEDQAIVRSGNVQGGAVKNIEDGHTQADPGVRNDVASIVSSVERTPMSAIGIDPTDVPALSGLPPSSVLGSSTDSDSLSRTSSISNRSSHSNSRPSGHPSQYAHGAGVETADEYRPARPSFCSASSASNSASRHMSHASRSQASSQNGGPDWSNFRFGSLAISNNESIYEGDSSSSRSGSLNLLATPAAERGPFEYPIHPDVQRREDREGSVSSVGSSSSTSAARAALRAFRESQDASGAGATADTASIPAGAIQVDIDDAMRYASTLRRTSTTSLVPSAPLSGRRPSVQHSATVAGDMVATGFQLDASNAVPSYSLDGIAIGNRRMDRASSIASVTSTTSSYSASASTSTSTISSAATTRRPSNLHASDASASATIQQIVASLSSMPSASGSSSSIATPSSSTPVPALGMAPSVNNTRRQSILLFSQQANKEGPIPPGLLNLGLGSRRGSLPTNNLAVQRIDPMIAEVAMPPTSPLSLTSTPLGAGWTDLNTNARSHPQPAQAPSIVSATDLYRRRASLISPPSGPEVVGRARGSSVSHIDRPSLDPLQDSSEVHVNSDTSRSSGSTLSAGSDSTVTNGKGSSNTINGNGSGTGSGSGSGSDGSSGSTVTLGTLKANSSGSDDTTTNGRQALGSGSELGSSPESEGRLSQSGPAIQEQKDGETVIESSKSQPAAGDGTEPLANPGSTLSTQVEAAQQASTSITASMPRTELTESRDEEVKAPERPSSSDASPGIPSETIVPRRPPVGERTNSSTTDRSTESGVSSSLSTLDSSEPASDLTGYTSIAPNTPADAQLSGFAFTESETAEESKYMDETGHHRTPSDKDLKNAASRFSEEADAAVRPEWAH